MSNFGIRPLPLLEIGQTDPLFVEEEESDDDDVEFNGLLLHYEKKANSLLDRCFLYKGSSLEWESKVKEVISELNIEKEYLTPSLKGRAEILVQKLEADLKFSVVYSLAYGALWLGGLLGTLQVFAWGHGATRSV